MTKAWEYNLRLSTKPKPNSSLRFPRAPSVKVKNVRRRYPTPLRPKQAGVKLLPLVVRGVACRVSFHSSTYGRQLRRGGIALRVRHCGVTHGDR
jgi:hypothetical protein